MENTRKVKNITTLSDFIELQKAYQFVLSSPSTNNNDDRASSTWQDRMVRNYHSHLYKEYVLADMTRYKTNQIGMRWRTKQEVVDEKGFRTCGNKHCPSYDGKYNPDSIISSHHHKVIAPYLCRESPTKESDEIRLLEKIPEGIGLFDYEVHFAYQEQGISKSELVKLRLCLRCAPKLFYNCGGALKARMAREKATQQQQQQSHTNSTNDFKTQTSKQNEKNSQMRDTESDDNSSSSSSNSIKGSDSSSKYNHDKEYRKRRKRRRRDPSRTQQKRKKKS